MTTVGRAAVLDPDYVLRAKAANTPPQDIAEANRFVYAVLKSALVGTSGAKVVEKVGRFNGSTAWVNVRRHYELTGHAIRDQLRREIDSFSPLAAHRIRPSG